MYERDERDRQRPAPDDRVAALLSAAAAPTEHGPVPGEEAAMAAFRAAHQPESSRRSRMFARQRPRTIAAATAMGTGALLLGGIAPAANGSLPGAAQETAQQMLAKIGVRVPGPDERSDGHADQRGKSTDAPDGGGGTGGVPQVEGNQGKGDAVSDLARNTGTTGVDKGAEISGLASQGHSHAGEHGSAGSAGPPEAAGSSAGHAQVDTPNSGGADRPQQASGDGVDEQEQSHGHAGGANADAAGDGHRADGSQNRR